MLGSVQKYLRGQLDGLAMPEGVPGPLVSRITPPVQEKVKAPIVYLWGGHVAAGRQAGPRIKGFKKFPWVADLWLVYQDTPSDAFKNEPFPGVIDAIMWQLMTTTMPLFIDKDGNPVGPNAASASDTQIQAIGENFDLEYPPERLVLSQRQVWYSARIGVDVLEVVQA